MLVAFVIVVSAIGAAVLVALLVALIRQLGLLASSLQELQRQLVPTLEGIQADAEEVRRHLDRLGNGRDRDPG